MTDLMDGSSTDVAAVSHSYGGGYDTRSPLPTVYDVSQQTRELDTSSSGNATSAGETALVVALHVALHGVAMPAISLVGVVTNLANIVVLSKVIRRTRTSVYHILLAMAVADFLLMGVTLLYSARFSLRAQPIAVPGDAENIDAPSHFFYHTWDTFANVCGVASNWCVVAVALFRFVAVYFPLHAPVWCTRLRARVIIACIYVTSVVLNVPYALVVEFRPSTGKFHLLSDVDEQYKNTYYVALLVFYHVIPWAASIALVALLLLGLWSQRRIERASSKQEEQKNVEQRKLSATLVGVTACFVVSTAPKVIYQFLVYANDNQFLHRTWVRCFFVAAQMALLLNYAVNFFLYAFINRTYRNNLLAILRCRRKIGYVGTVTRSGATGGGHSVHTVTTTHLSASTELHPLKNGDEQCLGAH